MRSLLDCLDMHGAKLESIYKKDVKKLAAKNKRAGIAYHQAEMMAVATVIDTVQSDRQLIFDQLEKVESVKEKKDGLRNTGERNSIKSKQSGAQERYLQRVAEAIVPGGSIERVPATTALNRFLERVGKSFALNTVFWKSDSDIINEYNGFTGPPGDIYINNNAASSVPFTVWHETLHQLRKNYPELYDELVSKIIVTDEAFAAYKKEFDARRKGTPAATSNLDVIFEELIADFAGDQGLNPEFYRRMFEKNTSIAHRVIKIIENVIRKIRRLNSEGTQYIADVDKALDALVNAMSQYAGKIEKGTPGYAEGKRAVAKAGESVLFSYTKSKLNAAIGSKSLSKASIFISEGINEFDALDKMLKAEITANATGWEKNKSGKVVGMYDRRTKTHGKAGVTKDRRTSWANIQEAFKSNPELKKRVKELGKKYSAMLFDKNDNFISHPIEQRTKPADKGNWAESSWETLPLFGGFRRSLTQTFLDRTTLNKEQFRSELNRFMETLYRRGDRSNLLSINLDRIGESDYSIPSAVRAAEKTAGAINLNSMCPMFIIGNHGCYFDGCYVTGIGKGGTGVNFYDSAMYLGELLQLSDAAVNTLNKAGGLRVNGVGDTVYAHKEQWEDILRHADMRKLKLKVITKQDVTFRILDELQKSEDKRVAAAAKRVVVQTTVDPYWIPVTEDNVPGAAMQFNSARNVAEQQEVLKSLYGISGRATKMINGQLYRKYGFSWEQLKSLSNKYPGVRTQPRLVVGTPKEIAEYALNTPEIVQTWMHAAIRPGMYSEVEGKTLYLREDVPQEFRLLKDKSEIGNYAQRISINKVNGEWQIRGHAKKGTAKVKSIAVYTYTEQYIKDNYTKAEQEKIFSTLAGQLDKNPSALCCAVNASVDACLLCTSHCHQGTYYTGNRLSGILDRGEGIARFSKAPPVESKAFKDWFGKSEITNPDGSPRVVYHGSKELFNEFRATRFADRLMFFSTNPEFASKWASSRQKKPESLRNAGWSEKSEKALKDHWAEFHKTSDELYERDKAEWIKQYDALRKTSPPTRLQVEGAADAAVYPVYIRAENMFNPEKDFKKIEATLRSMPSMEGVLKEGLHKTGNWVVYENKDVINKIEALGYDGLWLKESALEGEPTETIAVWGPTQIKSATGNIGTFDPNNPDIRFSKAFTEGTREDRIASMASARDQYSHEDFFIEDMMKKQKRKRASFKQELARKLKGKYSAKVRVPKDIASYVGDYGHRITVGDQSIYFIASSEGGTIYLPNIVVDSKGTGLGNKFMTALKDVADNTGQDIIIYKVTNSKFFEKFDWLKGDATDNMREFKYTTPEKDWLIGVGDLMDIWNSEGTPKFSKAPIEDTNEFKTWSKDYKVLRGYDISTAPAGTGLVFRVDHGTTNGFNIFDPTVKGSAEAQFGKVNYFTSDPGDADLNYAGVGPDLTNRIERRKELIEDELGNYDEDEIAELAEEFGLEFDPDTESYPEDLPAAMAEKELYGGTTHVKNVYVRADNPAFVNGRTDTWIENIAFEKYKEDAIEEVMSEEDVSRETAESDYEDLIRDKMFEMSYADEPKILEAITAAVRDSNSSANPSQVYAELELEDSQITASELEDRLRASDELMYSEDLDEGGYTQSQVIGQVFKYLGFDALVLQNADIRFPGMGLGSDTSHVHVFAETPENIKLVDAETFDDAGNAVPMEERFSESPDIRYSKVAPVLARKLEAGKKIKAFRAMQLIDGKLYPPMSAKIKGKLRDPSEIGQWEQAEENPDLADDKGYFKLDKGNKKSIKARYNPYFHAPTSPLNDQFSSAYDRPNLVTVEVEIPASELTSGYKAEKAKDSVGEMNWHSGPVSSKLPKGKKRTVILSRYAKVVRVVPDKEVAEKISKILSGSNIAIPDNVVTPSLRNELQKLGVQLTRSKQVAKAEASTDIRFSKTPWPKDFPNATLHTTLSKLRKHPAYKKAKSGDIPSAIQVISDAIKPEKIKALYKEYPDAIVVAPHAEEADGRNALPQVIAEVMHQTGFMVDTDIVQINTASRTYKDSALRLVVRPEFDGQVASGERYILVDDVIGQGGTLSELRDFIEKNGGKVVHISALTAGIYGAKISISANTIQEIESRFGKKQTEEFLNENNIAGTVEALTEKEGRTILGFSSLNALRNRISASAQKAGIKLLQEAPTSDQITSDLPKFSKTNPELVASGQAEIDRIIARLRQYVKKDEMGVSESKTRKLATQYVNLKKKLADRHISTESKIKEFKSLLMQMPIHVRGKSIAGFNKLASVKNMETKEKHFQRLRIQAEQEVNKHFRRETLKAIDKMRKLKVKVKGHRKTNIGAPAARVLEYINKVLMDTRLRSVAGQEELIAKLQARLVQLESKEPTAIIDRQIQNTKDKIEVAEIFGGYGEATLSDLEHAYTTLETLIVEGRTGWQQAEEARKAITSEMTSKVIKDVTGEENPEPETPAEKRRRESREDKSTWFKIKRGLSNFDTIHQSWHFLLDKISTKGSGRTLRTATVEILGGSVQAATNMQQALNQEATSMIQDRISKLTGLSGVKLDKWVTERSEKESDYNIVSTTRSGQQKQETIPLSDMQAAYWWAINRRGVALATDGVDSVSERLELMGVTPKFLKQVEAVVDPAVLDLAEWLSNTMGDHIWQGANTVHEARYGASIPRSLDYTPIWADYNKGRSETDLLQRQSRNSSMIKGALHDLTGTRMGVKSANLLEVWTNHINDMNHFTAWAIPVQQLEGVFGNQALRNFIEQHYGKEMNGKIKDFIEIFKGTPAGHKDHLSKMSVWRGRFATAVLGLNPAIYIKQLASIPAMAADIPVMEWNKGIASFLTNPKRAVDILSESQFVKTRHGTGHTRDVAAAQVKDLGKLYSGRQNVAATLMQLVKMGDMQAIYIGGWPVYKYYNDKYLSDGLSRQEAHRKAIARFEQTALQTQQTGEKYGMGLIQQGSAMEQLFTMFMSAPVSYYREVAAAVRNMGKSPKDSIKRLALFWVVVPAMFSAIANAPLAFDDDDDDQKLFWKRLGRDTLLGPISGIFLARDAAKYMYNAMFLQAENWSGLGFSPMAQPATTAGKLIGHMVDAFEEDKEFSWSDFNEDLVDMAGYITGLPTPAAQNYIQGLDQIRKGETQHPAAKLLGYTNWSTGDKKEPVAVTEFSKLKRRGKKAQDGLDKLTDAKSIRAYRAEHIEDLRLHNSIKSIQSDLNKLRRRINELKKKPDNDKRKALIDVLEQKRIDRISMFINKRNS